MPITKASGNSVTAGAKGDLVVGSATNDSGILAVGSANQVLTVDSSTATGLKWAAAGGGAFTLLASGTLSGSNLDLTSISGTYRDLRLVLTNYSMSTRGTFDVIINNDTAGNYCQVGIHKETSTAGGVDWTGFGSGFWRIPSPWNVATGTTNYNVAVITFLEYAETTGFKVGNWVQYSKDNTSTEAMTTTAGVYKSTTAISRITVDPEGTRTWSSGNYFLYGVK